MTNDQYLESIPVTVRNTMTNAWNGSKAAAVKAKCLQCKDFSRAEIKRCTNASCALHTVRPFQPKTSN
jgi:hypothetical protein